jgi:NADH:ubiquinone oxidoreductase subunit 2 (subunit N)
MTLGNVVACRQTNIKRMLAYSSIAHSGYILIAIVCLRSVEFAIPAVLAYLVVYILMNAGAFSVVIAFSNSERRDDLEAYNGLMQRSPFLAVSWVIFAMSLAGLPPAAGFLGKLYIFAAATDDRVRLYWLAIVGVVNAVISAWYYFRVTRHMFFCKAQSDKPIPVQTGVGLAIALCLAGTLLLVPGFPALYGLIEDAARLLGNW